MSNTRQVLLKQRNALLEKLRPLDPGTVGEIDALNLSLDGLIASPSDDTYARYGNSAIEGIRAYLEKMQFTRSEDAIVTALINGGWLRGNPTNADNIRASIKYHLKNTRLGQLKRFPSGRVGMGEWTDDHDYS